VKYLRQIIEIMSAAEILVEGVVSLQTMDETTLKVIDRSNIKMDKYNELSTEFRRANLLLAADIMMGMPGSTPAAFSCDLQKCTDRDIRVRANATQLRPNSPMNEPSYREEHGIVALPGEIVKQWGEMDDHPDGRTTCSIATEFYDQLQSEVARHASDWSTIGIALRTLESYIAPTW
jgi:hypothetical protein